MYCAINRSQRYRIRLDGHGSSSIFYDAGMGGRRDSREGERDFRFTVLILLKREALITTVSGQ